nr:hypothetical protein [Angustibacter aerolatus]
MTLRAGAGPEGAALALRCTTWLTAHRHRFALVRHDREPATTEAVKPLTEPAHGARGAARGRRRARARSRAAAVGADDHSVGARRARPGAGARRARRARRGPGGRRAAPAGRRITARRHGALRPDPRRDGALPARAPPARPAAGDLVGAHNRGARSRRAAPRGRRPRPGRRACCWSPRGTRAPTRRPRADCTGRPATWCAPSAPAARYPGTAARSAHPAGSTSSPRATTRP